MEPYTHREGGTRSLRLFAFCLARRRLRSDEKTRHKCVKLMTTAAGGEKRERRGVEEEREKRRAGADRWESGREETVIVSRGQGERRQSE